MQFLKLEEKICRLVKWVTGLNEIVFRVKFIHNNGELFSFEEEEVPSMCIIAIF